MPAAKTRSRAKPLIILGILFLVLGVLRVPYALSITDTASNDAQVFSAFASTVVFLVLGVVLLRKGIKRKKNEGQINDPGTNSSAG